MPSSVGSADEGEIVEAPLLPRSEKDGDVDRAGRHRARASQTPELDASYGRRSKSPRGSKRPRDERDSRRDPRQFRVHYEQNGHDRDDRRHGRDLDRPVSRESYTNGDGRHRPQLNGREAPPTRQSGPRSDNRNGRDRDYDRGLNGHPDKRTRFRSPSPRDRHGRGRRDRDRFGREMSPDENKYSAQAERHSQEGSMSKRAAPVEASTVSRHDAKTAQGVSVERGINGLAISGST